MARPSRRLEAERVAALPGHFFLDVGISSTHHIARFWRLPESLVEMPRSTAPMSAPTEIPTSGRAFVIAGAAGEGSHGSAEASLAQREEWRTYSPLDPNAVIAAAFKAARQDSAASRWRETTRAIAGQKAGRIRAHVDAHAKTISRSIVSTFSQRTLVS